MVRSVVRGFESCLRGTSSKIRVESSLGVVCDMATIPARAAISRKPVKH
jgi:hypothetical protein